MTGVEQLGSVIRALRDGGWQGNAFDVADALWLARQGILSGRPIAAEIEQTSQPHPRPQPRPPGPRIDSEPKPPPPDRTGAGGSGDAGGGKSEPVKSGPEALLSIRHSARTGAEGEASRRTPGVSFLTPAARALPGGRELLRVLRPLRRRVPDPATWTLDEEATLQRYCEQRYWMPVLRPGRRRWLDLALVLDAGPSMLPWRQTLREFRVVLERSGAFRDVRTWHLDTAGERPALRSCAGGRSHHPRELVEPSGQRLVLLVSDAVSPAWNDATLGRWTELWGRRQPVALVQLFPEGFWDTTALADGRLCRVGATVPGQVNHQLRARAWRGHAAIESECPNADVPVPVVSLTPGSLGPWAALVAGNSSVWPVAIHLGLGAIPMPEGAGVGAGAVPVATPRERIDWFEARATRTAMKLLSALAAAPLRLPVMRLVQEAAVPESQLTHLAEVFVSGLLHRVSPPTITDPDLIDFDFHDGVRDALLSRNRAVEVLRVQHLVSDYVQKRFGQRLNFQALLEAGGAADTESVNLGPENGVFARVAADVLERLGSRYSSVVAQLRAPVQPTPPPPPPQPDPKPAPQPPGGTALAGKEVIYLGSSLEDFEMLKVAVGRAGGTVFGVHRDPSQISNERLAAADAWVVNFITTGAWDTAFRVIDRAQVEDVFRPFVLLSSDPRRDAIVTAMTEKGAVGCTADAMEAVEKLASAIAAPDNIDFALLPRVRREAVLRHPDLATFEKTMASGLFGGGNSKAWSAFEGHLARRSITAQSVAAILAAATDADEVQYYRGGRGGASLEFSVNRGGKNTAVYGNGASNVLQWIVENREPRLETGSWAESSAPDSELYLPWLDSNLEEVQGVFYLVRRIPAGFHEPSIHWLQSFLNAASRAFSDEGHEPVGALAQRTLLWVDDQPERIRQHVESLRVLGAEVHLAKDTLTALQVLADKPVEAVITDLVRKGERRGGFQLINRLQSEGVKLPIAVHSTTRLTPKGRAEIVEAGALVCTDRFEEVRAALEVALRERPRATRPPLAAREREATTAKPGKKPESSPLSGRRILWVDDHPEKIEGLMQRLVDGNTDLVTCKTSAEALERLKGARFDGIISDIGRTEGRWAGLDLLDELRRTDNFTPVAFFTTVRLADSMAEVAVRKGAVAISSRFDAIESGLGRIGPGWSQSVAIGQFTREPLFLSADHAEAVSIRMRDLGVELKLVPMLVEGFREAAWSPLWNPSRTARDPWVSLASLVRAATGYPDVLVAEAEGGNLFDRAEPRPSNERFAGPRTGRLSVFRSQATRLIQDLSDPSLGETAAGLTGARLLIPFHAGLIDIWTPEVHGFYARQVRWLEMLATSFPRGGRRETMAMA